MTIRPYFYFLHLTSDQRSKNQEIKLQNPNGGDGAVFLQRLRR